MKQIRSNSIKLVGFSVWLLFIFASPSAFAQAPPPGEISNDGITSYIFSGKTITVLLVLALVVQIVLWHRRRSSNRIAPAEPTAKQHLAPKKKYDRSEISKALKASASSQNSGRSLEEAIRMSQSDQPDARFVDVEGELNESDTIETANGNYGDVVEAVPVVVGSNVEAGVPESSIPAYEPINPTVDNVDSTEKKL